jgi:hypothetical protein
MEKRAGEYIGYPGELGTTFRQTARARMLLPNLPELN